MEDTVPLYIGRSMKDLNTMASDIPRINSAKLFIGTAEQVFCKAEDNMAKGDEELAYVMYMRFFNIITAIKKARDFRTNEGTFNQKLGSDKCSRAIRQAEMLATRVQKRYAEFDAYRLRRDMVSLRILEEQRSTAHAHSPARSASARASLPAGRTLISRAKSDDNYTYMEPL